MAIVKINGRSLFLNADQVTIEKTGAGKWLVDYGRAKFDVIGGRESGGASNEWLVRNVEFFGEEWIRVRSMRAAVLLGVQW